MTTISQTIAARNFDGGSSGISHGHGTARDAAGNVALFIAAPFIGLGYGAVYALVGMGAIACYGLKAIGIQCGVFKS